MKKFMMRIILIVVFVFGVVVNSNGQTWAWAKSGDGISSDEGNATCTDPNGNIFITGYFSSPTITFGTNVLTGSGNGDIFLVKYDANGNVLWARSSKGSNVDVGYSVSTDANGNAYLTGSFMSPTIVFGSYTLTGSGNGDVFIAKYDVNGNVLWAKSSIGSNGDAGYCVSTDASGNAYVTGYFSSQPITFGTYTLTGSGNGDVFLTKYDINGNVLWAKSSSGSNGDSGYSNSTDANGNTYVTGYYTSQPITFGTFTLNGSGYGDVFLTKYDNNGNVLWAKSSLGSSDDEGNSVITDASGNAYVTGYFNSPITTFDSFTLTGSGNGDVFLVKYDVNGNVVWAKNPHGNGAGYSLFSDANSIYLSGNYLDTLIIDTYTIVVPLVYQDPMFIARFDLNGNATYATGLASGGDDLNSICVDKFCNAYITGDFIGNPNTFIVGTNTLNSTGNQNVFLAKLSFTSICQSETGIKTSQFRFGASVFPNPNTGSFKIQIDNEIENGEMILINSLGQKVHEQKIVRGENDVVVKGIASGLYHYIILENKQQVGSWKIVMENVVNNN